MANLKKCKSVAFQLLGTVHAQSAVDKDDAHPACARRTPGNEEKCSRIALPLAPIAEMIQAKSPNIKNAFLF